jgi:hypothetical protein
MTTGLRPKQSDALDKALCAYIKTAAPRSKLITRRTEQTNDGHRTGIGRRLRHYCLIREGGTYSIFAKQYDSPNQAQREFRLLQAYRTLVACECGVASVEPLFCDEEVILCAGAEGVTGVDLLSLPDRERELLPEQFHCIGKWLAAFHRANKDINIPFKDVGGYRRFLTALLQDHLRDFGGRFIPRDLGSTVERTLGRMIDSAAACSSYGPCHGDFCSQNIVVDVSRKSSTVLDFEDVHLGYQVKDVAVFCAKLKLLELIMPQHSRLLGDLERSFLAGYAENRGADVPDTSLVRCIYLLRVASPLRYGRTWHVLHNVGTHIRRMRYGRLLNRELSALYC